MVADEYDPTDGRNRVLLGTDTKTRAPVYLPYTDRNLGVAIIGKAGTGKSSLLEHMILTDLEHGTPGMVIDPHGLLVQRVMQLATPEHAGRIILLEATLDVPFGLNLLAVREPLNKNDDPVTWAADSVVATVKKLYGESDDFLPRLERYLDLSARTLIPSRLTLLEVPRLFEDMSFRQQCLGRVTNLQEKERLQQKWAAYDRLRPVEQITHTESLVNRLERLFASSIIAGIIGSRETTVPFDEILSGDKMLIVSLPSDRLSPERCDFIGAMLLCALADRIFVRNVSVAKPPRLHLYLDEYQRFATVTTAELLEQGRKYNAGVTLAHQTLYQITDQRIRNAARHAGMLIALAVTRPDAEQLAGEFPIRPKEEWIETIEEVDGTEPVYVFSPTPAEDLFIDSHSDPEIDRVVKTLFRTSYPQGSRDQRKSAGIPPRSGGDPVDECVKIEAPDANELLVEAMNGRLSSQVFIELLLKHDLFLHFGNDCPMLCPVIPLPAPQVSTRRDGRMSRPPPPIRKDPTQVAEENEAIGKLFEEEKQRWLATGLQPWLAVHLEHKDALRAGECVDAFKKADSRLIHLAITRGWDRLTRWVSLVDQSDPLHPVAIQSPLIKTSSWLRQHPHVETASWIDVSKAIDALRQRLQLLVILSEGLERFPVRVATGERDPRRVRRHIMHPGQTHADALAELAGRLVHPPQRYVAHVRQPQQYYQVKLRPPLEGESFSAVVDLIRERSRRLYTRRERLAEDPAPIVDTNRLSPPVTRRPPEPPAPPPQDEPTG